MSKLQVDGNMFNQKSLKISEIIESNMNCMPVHMNHAVTMALLTAGASLTFQGTFCFIGQLC